MEHTAAELLGAQLYTWSDLHANPQLPPRTPGVYGWFFRTAPTGVPCEGCVTRDGYTLLYVGISPGRDVSTQNLRSRIRYHFRGNVEALRLTLGCLLEPVLGTALRRVGSGRRLTFGRAEGRLTEWMAENARVCWAETEQPRELEANLIQRLVLPLNLDQNKHGFRATLRRIRLDARCKARGLPVEAPATRETP
jgi:GIY-YIG catalytic domain